jgi:hypothetical protein
MRTLSLGGVRFSLQGDARWSMDPEDAELSLPADAQPVVAHVQLQIDADPALSPHGDRGIGWQIEGARVRVRSRGVRAELQRRADGNYIGQARVSTGSSTLSALLNATACALIDAAGGLILHAVALTDGQHTTALIGPPDAGKTTAANLCAGMRWVARDRLSVAPLQGQALCWALAGGEPLAIPQHAGGGLALTSIVRVERTAGGQPGAAQVQRVDAATAALLLRESIHAPEGADEGILVERALWLAGVATVARLRSPLDAPLPVDILLRP